MPNRAVEIFLASSVWASLLTTNTAFAQATAADRALAQELFDRGRALSEEGRWAEACPKFSDSHKLDPAGGTLLNLALCHEKTGKYASAWTEFHEAVGLAQRDARSDRDAMAREHIAALAARISRVRIDLTKVADVAGLELKIDDEPIRSLAVPIPLDPGKHRFVVSAPGKKPYSFVVDVPDEGSTLTASVAQLEDIPKHDGSTRRTWGALVGGTGAVFIATGVVFGALAISNHDESNRICPDTQCVDARAVDLEDRAITQSWIATAALGIGVTAAIAGAVLFFTAPRKDASALSRPMVVRW